MIGRLFAHLRRQWMGALALFLVLTGGVAYAAGTIGSADVINNSLLSADLKDNQAVKSVDVRDDTLAGGGLGSADLPSDAVGTDELASGAVTAGKLNAPAVFTSVGLNDFDPFACNNAGEWKDLSIAGYNEVGFYRDPFGFVHLRGGAVNCSVNNPIFTLPSGYAPGSVEELVSGKDLTAAGRIEIRADGTVNAVPAAQTSAEIFLDGVSFRCAPSGQNGCP